MPRGCLGAGISPRLRCFHPRVGSSTAIRQIGEAGNVCTAGKGRMRRHWLGPRVSLESSGNRAGSPFWAAHGVLGKKSSRASVSDPDTGAHMQTRERFVQILEIWASPEYWGPGKTTQGGAEGWHPGTGDRWLLRTSGPLTTQTISSFSLWLFNRLREWSAR